LGQSVFKLLQKRSRKSKLIPSIWIWLASKSMIRYTVTGKMIN